MHQLRESSRAVSQSGLSPAHHRNSTGLPEAKASGKCNDLRSVMILGPLDRGHSNWDSTWKSPGRIRTRHEADGLPVG